MRTLAFALLAAFLSAVVLLPLSETSEPASVLPANLPESYVFGPHGAATGGQLVVGLLLPRPDRVLLKDLIGSPAFDAFLKSEAELAAAGEEPEEEIEGLEVDWPDWRDRRVFQERAATRRKLSEAFEKQYGVRILFRALLAEECARIPLVLVDGRDLQPEEHSLLQAYEKNGGRLLRQRERVEDVGEARPDLNLETLHPTALSHEPLLALCAEVLSASPLIIHLEEDPLALQRSGPGASGVLIRFAQAPSTIRFRRLDGKDSGAAPSGAARLQPAGPASFRLNVEGLSPFEVQLEAEWIGEGLHLRRAWPLTDFVELVERRLFGDRVVAAGGTYALRAIYTHASTHEVISGHIERASLKQGEQLLCETEIESDAHGTCDLRLAVPADAEAGAATLRIGHDSFKIQIERRLRISLVTDRTLYKPDDLVHARVMVHESPGGRPAAGRKVQLRLGKARREVVTSSHGIASTSFPLVEAKAGMLSVHAVVEGRTATAPLQVRFFETPTFSLRAEPAHLSPPANGGLEFTIRARYTDGAPLVGGRVALEGHPGLTLTPDSGVTDSEGRFRARATPAPSRRGGALRVRVTDADGRVVQLSIPFTPHTPRLTVTAEVLSDAVVGLPCRFALSAPGQQRLEVRFDGGPLQAVALDATGRGQITYTPTQKKIELRVPDAAGQRVWRYTALTDDAARPLILLGRQVARVGEVLSAELRGPDGVCFVDVLCAGALTRTLSTSLAEGRGQIDLPLEPDLAGMLKLRAYRLQDGVPHGTVASALVLRRRGLEVQATPRQSSWRPGETAQIDVRLTDAAGLPSAGVVGYWAVDEALLELAGESNGHETVFDVLKPRPGEGLIELAEAGGEDTGASTRPLLGRVRAVAGSKLYTLQHVSTIEGRRAAVEKGAELAQASLTQLRRAALTALGRIPLDEIPFTASLRETLLWLIQRGELPRDALLDPWGTPFTFWQASSPWVIIETSRGPRSRSWRYEAGFRVGSLGPDLLGGSHDDTELLWRLLSEFDDDQELIPGRMQRFLRLVHRTIAAGQVALAAPEGGLWDTSPFIGPLNNGMIGIGGGAGGGFRGRGGGRSLGIGGGGRKRFDSTKAVHVRKDFPPTLCFVPEAVVGPDGHALLQIELADSITTWRTRLVASNASGATGVGRADLCVTQPLSVSPWIAEFLTVGDELELPVALRNGTKAGQSLVVSLHTSDHIGILGSAEATLPVDAAATGAVKFRVRALRPGLATVRIIARGAIHNDVVEHTIKIRPYAREMVETHNHAWKKAGVWQPAAGGGADGQLTLDCYTGGLTDVLSGFEGLIRQPSGCFEQTSSTLYPMVLASAYMQRTDQGGPELRERAKRLIAAGYERLLGFEVAGEAGGFSLFGRAPASAFLTAYGLMEFTDMIRVHPVDPGLLSRVVSFLRKRQKKDGSWGPARLAHQELWAAGTHPDFNCTAYTAWALARAGERTDKARAWLEARSPEIESPYSLALAALAHLSADAEAREGRALVRRLTALGRNGPHGLHWQAGHPTGLGARGRTSHIETSALVIQALLLEGRSVEAADRGLTRLVHWRGKDGRFGTTQSTILALQALLNAEDGAGGGGPTTVRVKRAGKTLATYTLPEEQPKALRLELGSGTAEGLSVEADTKRRLRVTLSRTFQVPWDQSPEASGRLTLAVNYPSETLPAGRPARATITIQNRGIATARLVTAEIGIPPGCSVEPKHLHGKGLARAERSKRGIVLYLLDLEAGASRSFELPFVPRHGLDVHTTPSRVYEYYVPDEVFVLAPQRVRAR